MYRGGWDEKAYKTLNELIRTSRGQGGYAVFDYDNTTIMNDVELNMMVYQYENLRFKISPEAFSDALTGMLPELDIPLKYKGKPSFTARNIAEDIAADYAVLYNDHIVSKAASLEAIQRTDEFKDFRAKMMTMYNCVNDTFGYVEAGTLWIASMLGGMSANEVQGLVRESFKAAMAESRVYRDDWESPERGKAGKVSVSVTKGMTLAPEIKDLYNKLRDNGIEVYICSASHEFVVEAMACDPEVGLGMDEDNVFGIRMKPSPDGGWLPECVPGYTPSVKEGKVSVIKGHIATKHGGKEPILTAGDSNGDYNMLTEFPDLKVGLIINCMRSGEINDLMTRAVEDKSEGLSGREAPLYIAQGRNPAKKTFIPTWESVPVIE